MNNGNIINSFQTNDNSIIYNNELTDFGSLQSILNLRIFEINAYGKGIKFEEAIAIN